MHVPAVLEPVGVCRDDKEAGWHGIDSLVAGFTLFFVSLFSCYFTRGLHRQKLFSAVPWTNIH